MTSRRKFIKNSILTGIMTSPIILESCKAQTENIDSNQDEQIPKVISTWDFGEKANARAWEILSSGGYALDAVEAGVKVIEADEDNLTVGIGGLPDRDGQVTLDACIMDDQGNAGSVCFLQSIKHPISVARKVMENTPHVMLAGAGALQFALNAGFKKENLLTQKARENWTKWLKNSEYKPIINIENHDTISMLALDSQGRMSGACTTSGLAYKLHGRVGDSPIIGAGMFVDNEVGGAAATGLGEAVMKTLGSFLVVELMRQGRSPQEACEEAILRIVRKEKELKSMQIGYMAMNKKGEVGGYSLQKGFTFATQSSKLNKLTESMYYLK